MGYTLSPSTISILEDCPRCFWLQVKEKVYRPKGNFPSLPEGMDKILKRHFDKYRKMGRLPPELAELKGMKLSEDYDQLNMWRNSPHGLHYVDPSGNLFHGSVDELLESRERLIVLDFKARGFPIREETPYYYKGQMDIYNLLIRKNRVETEDFAFLLFMHPARVVSRRAEDGGLQERVVFHTDLAKIEISVEHAERLFARAVEVLNGLIPKPRKGCVYCEYAAKASSYL